MHEVTTPVIHQTPMNKQKVNEFKDAEEVEKDFLFFYFFYLFFFIEMQHYEEKCTWEVRGLFSFTLQYQEP